MPPCFFATASAFSIVRFTNLGEVDPSCYARFTLVIDRLAD